MSARYEMTPKQRTAFRAGKVIGRDEALREAAAWFDRYDTDSAAQLRRMADAGPDNTTPAQPTECPGLDGRFNNAHDWRETTPGTYRCGYCPATRRFDAPDTTPAEAPHAAPCRYPANPNCTCGGDA